MENVRHNYSYCPILIDSEICKLNRDDIYNKLKENNIHTRRYFYPLISNFSPYRSLPSARKENLQIANRIAENILCLPMYSKIEPCVVKKIVEKIKEIISLP